MDEGGFTGNDIDDIIRQAERAGDAETARWHSRRAMRLDAHRPEPHTILGDWQEDLDRAEAHYRRAMELVPEPPTPSRRSYSPAHLPVIAGLIGVLARAGRTDELIEYGRQALLLDPQDQRDLRAELLGPLIERGYYEEADMLLRRFAAREHDFAARMSNFAPEDRESTAYARALLEFARTGDTEQARAHLSRALATSLKSEVYLLAEAPLPVLTREYLMTDESDAAIVASRMLGAFRATPGATDWLRRHRGDLLEASLYLSDSPGASPAVGALRAALRGMVRQMAPDYGTASAHEITHVDGTLVLEVDGELADIRRLILAVFHEGFSGLHVEVSRPEMLAALEHLYPMGLSASTRDVPGLSHIL